VLFPDYNALNYLVVAIFYPIAPDYFLNLTQISSMIRKTEILNNLKASKSDLHKFGVIRIGLFGSVIREESNNDSDVDILIDFSLDQETFENYMNTCNYLESLFKGLKLDIGTENGLSPYIGPYILKEVEYA
jgi:uncharacterized protein